MIYVPSEEIETALTAPSCFASMKYSLKSSSQTLKS